MSTFRPEMPPHHLTMYDLPSEYVGDSGLPDLYHLVQGQLLSETFQPRTVAPERFFTAIDLNLYFDRDNPLFYKRPDWYAVVGVPRLYAERDLRKSYVLWDEQVPPLIVIELLSPGTEAEDLGRSKRQPGEPPTKWEAYARYVRLPYYVVFSGETLQLQAFAAENGQFVPRLLASGVLWLPEVQLGLGVWTGEYAGAQRSWLRWQLADGRWLPTQAEAREQAEEQARQERQRAEQERQARHQAEQQLARLRERLRQAGLDPEALG